MTVYTRLDYIESIINLSDNFVCDLSYTGDKVVITQVNSDKSEMFTTSIEIAGHRQVKLSVYHHTSDKVVSLLSCRRNTPKTLNKTLCGLLNKFEQRLGIDPLDALIASLEAL